MPIPVHQIHNVLNAYARRLAESCRENGGGYQGRARSLSSDKRRFVIDQIIEETLQKVISAGHESSAGPGPEFGRPPAREEKSHLLRYHRIFTGKRKFRSVVKIIDLDFPPAGEDTSPPPAGASGSDNLTSYTMRPGGYDE